MKNGEQHIYIITRQRKENKGITVCVIELKKPRIRPHAHTHENSKGETRVLGELEEDGIRCRNMVVIEGIWCLY